MQPPIHLATAIEIVVRAGELQMARLGGHMRVEKKGEIDLVTEVDLEVEAMARALIADRFPGHVMLAEEQAGADLESAPSAAPCWVFDPVDGTTNYAHGLPMFCSALALEIDGRAEVAAVYEPARQELFTAERGAGAYMNGAPIRVSHAESLLDSLLCTGFPYDVHQTGEEIVGLFGRFVARARGVRRLGSAAIDLCYVACGRLDGFWEQRLKPWDIAAAALIVEEAGGIVTGMDGSPFTSRRGHLAASAPAIHDDLVGVIRTFYAERAPNRTL